MSASDNQQWKCYRQVSYQNWDLSGSSTKCDKCLISINTPVRAVKKTGQLQHTWLYSNCACSKCSCAEQAQLCNFTVLLCVVVCCCPAIWDHSNDTVEDIFHNPSKACLRVRGRVWHLGVTVEALYLWDIHFPTPLIPPQQYSQMLPVNGCWEKWSHAQFFDLLVRSQILPIGMAPLSSHFQLHMGPYLWPKLSCNFNVHQDIKTACIE